MKHYRLSELAWAVSLIIGGVILLLFNFDLLAAYEPVAQFVMAGGLAVGGVGFFVGFATGRENWWRLIPGWTLLALAAMVVLSVFPAVAGPLIASLLFVGLALAFAHIYLLNRSLNWWAILPGGFFLVIAAVIVLSASVESLPLLGSLLFVGIGLVFFSIYLLGDRRRQWWALIPGGILLLFGLFVLTAGGEESSGFLRWWPLLAIVAGVVVGWCGIRRQPAEKLVVNRAPAVRPTETASAAPTRAALGEYSQPAPGAEVQVLSDSSEK